MAQTGLQEEQAIYVADDPQRLVGQFRRLGPAGPAYEIMKVEADGTVHVEIVYNDEKLVYPLSEILADPLAETIP